MRNKNIETISFGFKVNKIYYYFSINHNLSKFGLDIEKGFYSWCLRTKDYSKESFINYLKNKSPNAIVV